MEKKISMLTDILKKLVDGADPEKVKKESANGLLNISSTDLAEAEEVLLSSGVSVEDIQRANQLHADLVIPYLSDRSNEYEHGHPAFVFIGENMGIKDFIYSRLKPDLDKYLLSKSEKDKKDLLYDAQELQSISKHYERKENLFFPYLEKAGITAPPKVMWGADDIIRHLMQVFVEAIEEDDISPERIKLISERLLPQIVDMIEKENEILIPMLKNVMTDADWLLCAKESGIIGYIFNKGIEGASNSDANTWITQMEEKSETSGTGKKDDIALPSGYLSTKQLDAMLNTLPTDLTFVDDKDIVRYYTEGKHQVFTRTRTIIGRNIYLCHPPKLVPVIKKLIEDFRSGKKDEEIVPVRKGSKLDLVRYYAVRDSDGAYLGTVEVTEEISGILDMLKE